MQNVLILVAFVTVAYGLAHKVVGRLQQRFLVANGPEYILVGLLLGPAMPWPAAIEEATLVSVAPIITLAIVFRDIRYSLLTTSPVIATVALQWLVMWQLDVPLSLVTVMIGSILVGVGVDFSIHIANRIRELGGGIEAIRTAAVGTGMSLAEAATVTSLGMMTAYQIPIPEIKPFLTVILILLWVAAAGALVLLPAIFVAMEKAGMATVGGRPSMANKLGLGRKSPPVEDVVYDAVIIERSGDAW